MKATGATQGRPESGAAAFGRVVCGVDASRTDPEAVRQAAALVAPAGSLELVCVAYESGAGPSTQVTLPEGRASAALARAREVAAEAGVEASTREIFEPDRWKGIAQASAGSDLLVLGGHMRSRPEGIIGGSLGTEALHRADVPVLLARASSTRFPERILLATDGSEDSRRAVELTVRICARHECEVTVVTVGDEANRGRRHELAEQTAALFGASGVESIIDVRDGSPGSTIVALADADEASLVVLGSGGKRGVRALGSVSEHVAHHVRCSALVARPPSQ
jgi:nucleotide-binding universal stress UspA family protein